MHATPTISTPGFCGSCACAGAANAAASAPSTTMRNFRMGSHSPGAQLGNREGRIPGRGSAHAIAVDMNVEEIGPALDIGALCALQRRLDAVRIGNDFAFDAESLRRFREIDIRAAIVASHVLAGLELLAGDERPDAIALVIVATVVDDDVGDRRLVARLAPQRLRPAEHAAAIANAGHDRAIRTRELGAGRGGN